MATGALLNGKCYSSNAEAVDAYFSAALPAFTSGSTSYLSEYIKDSAGWKIARFSVDSGGLVTALTQSPAPHPTFPECDPLESFTDGMTIAWGIALCMVCAWCIKSLRRGV